MLDPYTLLPLRKGNSDRLYLLGAISLYSRLDPAMVGAPTERPSEDCFDLSGYRVRRLQEVRPRERALKPKQNRPITEALP
jgi:hypothetical protein